MEECLTLHCNITAIDINDYTSRLRHGRGDRQRFDQDGSYLKLVGGLDAVPESGLASTVVHIRFLETIDGYSPPLDELGNTIPVGHLQFTYMDRGSSKAWDGCPHPMLDVVLVSPEIGRIDKVLLELFSLAKFFGQRYIRIPIDIDLRKVLACSPENAWKWNSPDESTAVGHQLFWIYRYSIRFMNELALSEPPPYYNSWFVEALRRGERMR